MQQEEVLEVLEVLEVDLILLMLLQLQATQGLDLDLLLLHNPELLPPKP